MLSGLTSLHEDADILAESDLSSLRLPMLSVFDSYLTCPMVANSDAYYDVVEIYLASILAIIARNVSEVSQTSAFEIFQNRKPRNPVHHQNVTVSQPKNSKLA